MTRREVEDRQVEGDGRRVIIHIPPPPSLGVWWFTPLWEGVQALHGDGDGGRRLCRKRRLFIHGREIPPVGGGGGRGRRGEAGKGGVAVQLWGAGLNQGPEVKQVYSFYRAHVMSCELM